MALNNENNNECCKCTTPEYTIILNEQGPQGRQGATGQNGFSPIIDVTTNTRDTYKLTITTADGVIVTPNLKSEPIPSGGNNGQVLINYGNDAYGWGDLPLATTETSGVVFLATDEDFQPDDEGNINNTTAITPAIFNNQLKTQFGNYIVAGNNITTSVGEDGKVTINSTAEPFTLPQATATALGGIKANEKDDTDTQEVKIDPATGLLYTKAGGDNITSIDGGNAQTNGVVAYQNTTFYANSAIVNNGLVGQDKVTIQDGEV